MSFLNRKKFNSGRSKWPVMVLIACFSLIALFGSPWHDHDPDSSHVDLDCIACHLVQSNIGLEDKEPNLSPYAQVAQWIEVQTTELFVVALSTASSRAPPAFC